MVDLSLLAIRLICPLIPPRQTRAAQLTAEDFKSALGHTAYQILSAGTLASLVVIQAAAHQDTDADAHA